MAKKKKEEVEMSKEEIKEAVASSLKKSEEQHEKEDKGELSKPTKKQKEYKKTLHMAKDRFGNPRSQRDFESTLRNFLDEEEAYKAWKTWSDGGTVTLVIKK